MGGIFSIEARDMDTKLLSAPESNNTLARCWLRRNVPVTTFESWHDKLLTLVVGCFQWLALCFYSSCWGGSTSPEGFFPSTLLLLVIIVAVVMVVTGSGTLLKDYSITQTFVCELWFLARIVLCLLEPSNWVYGNGFLQS
ncbi:hypothetical protein Tco_0260593 [Tanacetum coccineum]